MGSKLFSRDNCGTQAPKLHAINKKYAMEIDRNRDGSSRVWMDREEYRVIPQTAQSTAREIAIRLMGDCGLRVSEVLTARPRHISPLRTGRHFELKVPEETETLEDSSNAYKRATWLPATLQETITLYVQCEGIDDDELLIGRSKRTVQYWVKEAAAEAAAVIGDPDYQLVSAQDLRRCWVTHLLCEACISPRIVMALGGWSSYEAIKPYLPAPTEENIICSMANAEL